MRYHLFQKFFGKMVKIKEMSFPSTKGMYLSCHGCIFGTPEYQFHLNRVKHFPSPGVKANIFNALLYIFLLYKDFNLRLKNNAFSTITGITTRGE